MEATAGSAGSGLVFMSPVATGPDSTLRDVGGACYLPPRMPSKALAYWKSPSRAQLDEFEDVHKKVGGTRRGRRYLTEQLNRSYLVAVSAQFQRFCRDLHTEAVQRVVGTVKPELRFVVTKLFTNNRKLDAGNANEANLGPDFGRLGMKFFPAVDVSHRRNKDRRLLLKQLNAWRNAVVHEDFNFNQEDQQAVKDTKPMLRFVRAWRKNCDELALEFDKVVRAYTSAVVGGPRWE